LFTSGVQGYGHLVNVTLFTDLATFAPLNENPLVDPSCGLFYRNYTTILVVVNPTTNDCAMRLADATGAAKIVYVNATGGNVVRSGTKLGAGEAVLLEHWQL
jgi:hypothetical protein